METTYCIDTSGWTHAKRGYPLANFPSLWTNLDNLVNDKRLFSPNEVYRELEKQDDELFRWLKQRKKLFIKADQEHIALTLDIMARFPKLVNPNKLGPVADPFVIALAIVMNRNLMLVDGRCIVVSGETPGGSKKNKIPDVCREYQLTHFAIVDLISNEGWVF
jgi:hypothetical protein